MCFIMKSVSAVMALLVILIIQNGVYGAVFTQKALDHPAYPGKCFNPLTKRAMLPEKQYKLKGICAAMSCDIDNLSITIETCPIIDMPGCEEIPSDASWSYPKCCPRYRCEDFKTGEPVIFDATSF